MWKNKSGHDEDSEILTLIIKLRKNKVKILNYNNINNEIFFQINYNYTYTVPVSNTTYVTINYKIRRDSKDNFYLEQINGISERKMNLVDGYIIWTLLEEKL